MSKNIFKHEADKLIETIIMYIFHEWVNEPPTNDELKLVVNQFVSNNQMIKIANDKEFQNSFENAIVTSIQKTFDIVEIQKAFQQRKTK